MARLYNMETGELLQTREYQVTAKWRERVIRCPSTDTQAASMTTPRTESTRFIPGLVGTDIETFIEQQK